MEEEEVEVPEVGFRPDEEEVVVPEVGFKPEVEPEVVLSRVVLLLFPPRPTAAAALDARPPSPPLDVPVVLRS